MQHSHRLKRKRYRLGFSSLGLTLMVACLSLAGIFWVSASSLEDRDQVAVMPVSQYAPQTKRIEDIQVGDYVLAKDPGDPGPPTRHKVIALPRNWTEHVVHVKVEGGGEVQATRMHPFWVQGKGWTDAVDLKTGDKLVDDQGKTQLVASAVVEDKTAGTYNLTVEGVHTFYALAGTTPILVHNMGIIYKVPGTGTPSGLPYIGRSDDWKTRQNYSGDGRDRTQAQQVDQYPDGNTQAGRQAEQNAIDQNGGVKNLDNKRNEIAKPCP